MKSFPLTPARLAFVQLWREPGGQGLLAAKGAPEAVFRLCGMDAAAAATIEAAVADFAASGLRVLAVASAGVELALDDPDAARFVFEGLVAFQDPVRADVPPALAQARAAGVEVAMITGDYPSTALEIARQAGLDVSGGVLTGADIAALDAQALAERVKRVRVFARIAPDQKLALVQAFRTGGAVVGMMGDGVNDAPALEAADVGVAMGRRGTDVAREAADLVLLDDRFASVVEGVAQGRRIFGNLRAALAYIVAVHLPLAGVALLPVLLGLPPVLFPMQVVVLELVIDPVCSIVFESRRADRGTMRRPPRPVDEPLFGPRLMASAVLQGGLVLAAIAALHWTLTRAGADVATVRAAILIAIVAANLGLAGVSAGARGGEGLRGWVAVAVAAALVLAASLYVPWLTALFQFEAPRPQVIGEALGAGALAGALAGWLGARVGRA